MTEKFDAHRREAEPMGIEPDRQRTGAELIAAERKRQTEKCGWSDGTDDTQVNEELLECAILVADDVFAGKDELTPGATVLQVWPHERANHIVNKYGTDHVKRLAIAGALIAAEIDRLLREKK